MSKLKTSLSIFAFIAIFFVFGAAAQDCEYWKTKVGVKNSNYKGPKKNERDPQKVIEGIECLLKLEGDTSRGLFSGATSLSGPVNMPESTVEICALYYISVLFYEKYRHANAVALVFYDARQNNAINSEEFVKTAFESYRKWFEKVKEIGLEEARKQNLDPLETSTVRWY